MATFAGTVVSDTDALRLRGVIDGPWRPTQFRSEAPDEMVDALIWALAEFAGEHEDDERSAFSEAKHPRNPKGSPGGGRFKSIAARVIDALEQHHAGKGDGDPLKDFNREQVRKVAKARGIEIKRGASEADIKKALVDHAAPGKIKADVPPAVKKVTKPVKPKVSKQQVEASHRAPGKDLLETIATDFGSQKPAEYEGRRRKSYDVPFDINLQAIGQKQDAFTKPPQVVTSDQVDHAVASGWTEMWRGVVSNEHASAADINHEFREGDYTPGRGIYGNGYYTSVDRRVGEEYRGAEPGPDSLLRMALDPKARVADYDQMKQEASRWRAKTDAPSHVVDVFVDTGRYAAARGYDVMIVRDRADGFNYPEGEGPADQYVIFNRSAVIVQRMQDKP